MRYVLDTDIFSLYLAGNAIVIRKIAAHATADVVLSIITVQELWTGAWTPILRAKSPTQTADAYRRLTDTMNEVRNWPIVTFPESALLRYNAFKKQKLNVRGNDMRIAAIALDLSATVVTRNVRDFGRIPGLTLEDWST
jgi:tRNA(fMet)-specific endonuclease VapC